MELRHHGILKQKWGVRNGPPYPLRGGDYTPAQRKAISNKRKSGNSIYNKKHFDEVLNADKTTLSTLSYDKDRTKNTDMFYATHNSKIIKVITLLTKVTVDVDGSTEGFYKAFTSDGVQGYCMKKFIAVRR
jgi:hypothetical protein